MDRLIPGLSNKESLFMGGGGVVAGTSGMNEQIIQTDSIGTYLLTHGYGVLSYTEMTQIIAALIGLVFLVKLIYKQAVKPLFKHILTPMAKFIINVLSKH